MFFINLDEQTEVNDCGIVLALHTLTVLERWFWLGLC